MFLNYCPGEAHKLNSYSREENLSNPNDTRTPENPSTREEACLYFSQDCPELISDTVNKLEKNFYKLYERLLEKCKRYEFLIN